MTHVQLIDTWLKTYFQAHQCSVRQSAPGIMHVQLTKEIDQQVMNRPFYWHYMKSIGQEGKPATLTLLTDPNLHTENGEWIHFGTPLFIAITRHLEQNSKFIRLFEQIEVTKQTVLQPWLVINYVITYRGKNLQQLIRSIGLNLINGMMLFEMMERLGNIQLSPTICDHCYKISPLIKLASGYRRIENYLMNEIMAENHRWASESIKQLEEEMKLINHFYEDVEDKAEWNKEVNELKERFEPKINIEVINGGVFYLTEAFIKNNV